MKSSLRGAATSDVEIANIDAHGIWVHVKDKEYFLPYTEFPWFKAARVNQILEVELHHGHHLHWPSLDVDLSLDALENPERYPLVAGHSNRGKGPS